MCPSDGERMEIPADVCGNTQCANESSKLSTANNTQVKCQYNIDISPTQCFS